MRSSAQPRSADITAFSGMWTVWDWKDYGVDSIIKTVTQHKHLGNGSIILCHNGAKYTADALDALIEGLQGEGYEIVPVSQLILRKDYHMDHEGRQIPMKHKVGSPKNAIIAFDSDDIDRR